MALVSKTQELAGRKQVREDKVEILVDKVVEPLRMKEAVGTKALEDMKALADKQALVDTQAVKREEVGKACTKTAGNHDD